MFTNDIVYAEIGFDMSGIPSSLLHLVPLFCRALTEMGTQEEDFVQLSERIGRKTGGISAYPFTTTSIAEDCVGGVKSFVMMRGKATTDKFGDFLDIVRDCMTSADLGNKERFRQMVLETKASQVRTTCLLAFMGGWSD